MRYRFDILEKEVVYQGFFRLERYRLRHELFAGGWSRVLTRELFERGAAAAILPYDPMRDAVVLIEQFRVGVIDAPGPPWLLEIVAGIIEEGESPESVVRREAVEEAGCTVGAILPIAELVGSPGGSSERMHLFCGEVDTAGAGGIHGLAEEGEDIRVRVERFDSAMALLASGRINSATPVIALQWLALNRERVRAQWRKG